MVQSSMLVKERGRVDKLFSERTDEIIWKNNSIGCANKMLNPHLKKAVTYIESNYHKAITLKDVIKVTALNHSTLTQLFKKELGMTPFAYVWYYRISISKQFLEFTDLPVKSIASRCGFKTVQHFSRKFEESCGCSPTAFRNGAVSNEEKGAEI